MRLVIVRKYDDFDPVILGYVDADTKNRDEIEKVVADEWSSFQETEPDSDTLFIEWLLENTGWEEYIPPTELEIVVD